jgi:hypothetical protein
MLSKFMAKKCDGCGKWIHIQKNQDGSNTIFSSFKPYGVSEKDPKDWVRHYVDHPECPLNPKNN